jgi:hypothetical protein
MRSFVVHSAPYTFVEIWLVGMNASAVDILLIHPYLCLPGEESISELGAPIMIMKMMSNRGDLQFNVDCET